MCSVLNFDLSGSGIRSEWQLRMATLQHADLVLKAAAVPKEPSHLETTSAESNGIADPGEDLDDEVAGTYPLLCEIVRCVIAGCCPARPRLLVKIRQQPKTFADRPKPQSNRLYLFQISDEHV